MPKPTQLKRQKQQAQPPQDRRVAMHRPKHKLEQPSKSQKPAPPRKPSLIIPRQQKQQRLNLPKSDQGTLSGKRDLPAIPGRERGLSFQLGPLVMEPELQAPSTANTPSAAKGEKATPSKAPLIDLRPDFGTLSRLEGAPAPDYLRNIPEGDSTQLNTREHIYASFFNRMKQQVAQHWSPNSVYRRRDPFGNVYGVRDRYTQVQVVLTKQGHIDSISVYSPSGLQFLDNEAIRAFRAAQPFPNPPIGLVDTDGKIRFRFGFHLQLSSGSVFSPFR
jgi:TonB family protein